VIFVKCLQISLPHELSEKVLHKVGLSSTNDLLPSASLIKLRSVAVTERIGVDCFFDFLVQIILKHDLVISQNTLEPFGGEASWFEVPVSSHTLSMRTELLS